MGSTHKSSLVWNSVAVETCGDARPLWKVDKSSNTLFLTGVVVDSIEFTESYDESISGNGMIRPESGKLPCIKYGEEFCRI